MYDPSRPRDWQNRLLSVLDANRAGFLSSPPRQTAQRISGADVQPRSRRCVVFVLLLVTGCTLPEVRTGEQLAAQGKT